ncbi:MAG TPA: hypothetical protein VFR35_16745 [Actinoplanes sp.]|nr:hypothetical protein [Actinoplanes sp.]
MNAVDRLARAMVAAAARRWPDDLAESLCAEWQAELDALRHDLPGFRRMIRALTFAGSLALSPAVDQPPWPERAAGLGRAASIAAGVTLLAAALFNAAHAVGGPGLLILAGLAMAALGTRVRMPATGAVALLGPALFAFLFVGNDVAVMPFMGFLDVAPAVATWTVLMLVTARLAGAARGARRVAIAACGGLLTMDLATIAGSVHAAGVLGLGPGSAPAWFPLALLPGGTAGFGPFFADGTAAFGTLRASGPAFHASDILLANAAAMAGPMLLCAVFALALAVRRQAGAAEARTVASTTGRIVVGAGAALGGLAIAEILRRSAPAVDTILHRLLDNSAVFGFGFLAHPAGRAGLALLVALLAIRAVDAVAATRRR